MEACEEIIRTMRRAGCAQASIDCAVAHWSQGNVAEACRLLKRERCRLLEEIHAQQQRLDDLDYLIHSLKK